MLKHKLNRDFCTLARKQFVCHESVQDHFVGEFRFSVQAPEESLSKGRLASTIFSENDRDVLSVFS